MSLAEELRASLQDFLPGASVEIRETGSRISPAGSLSWEVRGAQEKPLLHLWAENCNVTRRVLAITTQSGETLALAVERFGKSKPDRLSIIRTDRPRTARQLSRADFADQLRRILAEQFSDEVLEKISVTADLKHTLSGSYVRGVSSRGHAAFAFLAVPPGDTPDDVENSLTFALLWLDRARQSARGSRISALRLLVPKGKSSALANRLAALDPRLAIQLFELDPLTETLERVDPCAEGNIATWLVPRREAQLLLDRAESALAPIIALAPDAIRTHVSFQNRAVVLRFRGFPFVAWDETGVHFGLGDDWQELNAVTERNLHIVIDKLRHYRSPDVADIQQSLTRVQAERWMQSVILEDIRPIDVTLDPQFVYEQVFVRGPAEHGIVDLLGVTRSRRLAILELKATENVHLPLQAADYYSRISRHLMQGDFPRYGYFPGIELQQTPPLVFLVAPSLYFHPTTSGIVRYLRPEIEVVRVGLAESWRRGVHVVMRQ